MRERLAPWTGALLLLGVGLSATPAATASGREAFERERAALQVRLTAARALLPDRPDPDRWLSWACGLAGEGLAGVACRADPPGDAAASQIPIVVPGQGRYDEVASFVGRALPAPTGRAGPLATLERLDLSGLGRGSVSFAARLDIHYGPPAPPPIPQRPGRFPGVAREEGEAYDRDLALLAAKTAAIERAAARPDPLAPLEVLDGESAPGWIGLREAVLGPTFRLRGFKVLPGSASLMRPALERGGLQVSGFKVAREGLCDHFDIVGRWEPVTPASARSSPDLRPRRFFDEDEGVCAIAGPSAPPVRVDAADAGAGPFVLRLRDVDLVDALRVLHQLASEAFVVDGDVAVRVSADLEGVTLEQALAALQQAPVTIGRRGRFLRVSPPGRAWPAGPPPPSQEVGIPLDLKGGDVQDLLRLIGDVTGLPVLAPSGDLGRVSVRAPRATGAPADSAGLRVVRKPDRILVERDAAAPAAALAPPPAHVFEERARIEDERARASLPTGIAREHGALSGFDVELVGLVRHRGEWSALVTFRKGAVRVAAGHRLAEGRVESVDRKGLTLRTDSGAVLRIALPPLP